VLLDLVVIKYSHISEKILLTSSTEFYVLLIRISLYYLVNRTNLVHKFS